MITDTTANRNYKNAVLEVSFNSFTAILKNTAPIASETVSP